MKTAHGGTSRYVMGQFMPQEQMAAHTSPDYFNEALRILDNDLRISPQREHLAALWGLVIGLSRRLTETRVTRRNHRSGAISDNRRKHKKQQESQSG